MLRLVQDEKTLVNMPYDVLELIFVSGAIHSLSSLSLVSKALSQHVAFYGSRLANTPLLLKMLDCLSSNDIAELIRWNFKAGSVNAAMIQEAAQEFDNHVAVICATIITNDASLLNLDLIKKAVDWMVKKNDPARVSIRRSLENVIAVYERKWQALVFEGDRVFLNLNGLSCISADFHDKTIGDAIFDKTCLKMPRFDGALMERASFQGAEIVWPNFNNAILQHANFRNASLQFGLFRNADLRGVNFVGVRILGGDFSNVKLEGAKFIDDDEFNNINEFAQRLTTLYHYLHEHKNFALFRHAILQDIAFHAKGRSDCDVIIKAAYSHPLISEHRNLSGVRLVINSVFHLFAEKNQVHVLKFQIKTHTQKQ